LGGVPVLFDGDRPGVKMPPRLGEHTLSSLKAAGVGAAQMEQWIAKGAIIQNERFES
jgi:hypothetical protein